MTTLTQNIGIEYNISAENPNTPRTPLPAKRKKRFKDRPDGRYIRTLHAMNKFMPFIMPDRNDALNQFADEFDITETENFCRQMVASGRVNFSILHVILAAYIRTVSQRPALNRFVNGQRIYARNDITVVMTIKKAMTADSPDTCIKVHFAPDDTVYDVYDKFNAVVEENKKNADLDSDFDKTANTLANLPRPILRGTVRLLNWLDYHGKLPKALVEVSPFHGGMIITSMGSLGIKPIYHHIYNFGNLPLFISYGKKEMDAHVSRGGVGDTYRKIDIKVVTDERICDGFHYAAAFKILKKYVERPGILLDRPEVVVEDIE
ncbi:MAG: hypothetical protein IJX74_05865 [Clostridia bacterium]|nr:hypothetical protein [Clostridia bacterium]